jgi:hypothetical protein
LLRLNSTKDYTQRNRNRMKSSDHANISLQRRNRKAKGWR